MDLASLLDELWSYAASDLSELEKKIRSSLKGHSSEGLLKAVLHFVHDGQHADAKSLLHDYVKNHHATADIQRRLALILHFEKHRAPPQLSIKSKQRNKEALLKEINALVAASKLSSAEELLLEAIESTEEPDYLHLLSRVYMLQRRPIDGAEAMQRALLLKRQQQAFVEPSEDESELDLPTDEDLEFLRSAAESLTPLKSPAVPSPDADDAVAGSLDFIQHTASQYPPLHGEGWWENQPGPDQTERLINDLESGSSAAHQTPIDEHDKRTDATDIAPPEERINPPKSTLKLGQARKVKESEDTPSGVKIFNKQGRLLKVIQPTEPGTLNTSVQQMQHESSEPELPARPEASETVAHGSDNEKSLSTETVGEGTSVSSQEDSQSITTQKNRGISLPASTSTESLGSRGTRSEEPGQSQAEKDTSDTTGKNAREAVIETTYTQDGSRIGSTECSPSFEKLLGGTNDVPNRQPQPYVPAPVNLDPFDLTESEEEDFSELSLEGPEIDVPRHHLRNPNSEDSFETDDLDFEDLDLSVYEIEDHLGEKKQPSLDNFEEFENDFDLYDFDPDDVFENKEALVPEPSDSLDHKLSWEDRALQKAAELVGKASWPISALPLVKQIFVMSGWGATRLALEREIAKGLTPEELILASHIKVLWAENDIYWISGSSFSQGVLSWPAALLIVRSFDSIPQVEEIDVLLEDLFIHWYESTTLRRIFKAFALYLWFRFANLPGCLPANQRFDYCNPCEFPSEEYSDLGLHDGLDIEQTEELRAYGVFQVKHPQEPSCYFSDKPRAIENPSINASKKERNSVTTTSEARKAIPKNETSKDLSDEEEIALQ